MLLHGLHGKALGVPRRVDGVDKPAQTICAHHFEGIPRVKPVAARLAHLLAVFVKAHFRRHYVNVGGPPKGKGRDGEQSVEPTARLINPLADVVCGEAFVKHLFVFKGVVPLREGHGARVIPAVEHFAYALHLSAAFFASQKDAVDIGSVQVQLFGPGQRHAAELVKAPHTVLVPALAAPNRQRRAPVALAADSPVYDVFEEVAKTPGAQVLWEPVNGIVVGEHLLLKGGHADKPRAAGVIEQWGVTAPTERIVMGAEPGRIEKPFILQEFYDVGVGIFNK
ncbi:MAG: hypothetical protein DDT39_01424 [Firmicutes bacterium]|nr:hypothetical protein [candidate division NPL-UPA2 bacterium]